MRAHLRNIAVNEGTLTNSDTYVLLDVHPNGCTMLPVIDSPKQAIGYVRVSSEEQRDQGVSLEAQQAKIQAWATFTDATLLAVHIDAGISGKRADNRPGLQLALADARRHRCPLVVYSLSRLSRSVMDTLTLTKDLERAGADLVSLSEDINTTTAAGRMVFKMLSVLAEFEREQLAERTTVAMAHLRHLGRRISGKIPYGYTLAADGASLIEDPDEQAGIRRMVALRSAGYSLRAIGECLEAEGHWPKASQHWAPASILGVLKRQQIVEAAA
ncbi:MAG: recombinase family protein [Planctomycetota bacterium]|nr:MAG: recombinase family protein [Planctomycetota bacterium]